MSGERCCPGAGSMAHVRGCVNHPEHTPTPEPSEVAETTAGERECRYPCGCDQFPDEHCACMDGHTPAEPDAGEVEAPRHVWISDSVCIDSSRIVSAKIIRAPLPRYAGQFLGGRRDVVLTLDTGKEHTVTAVDEDNRRRDFESYEPADQRDRVEAAARAWVDDLLARGDAR